jgi:hypothetical protein
MWTAGGVGNSSSRKALEGVLNRLFEVEHILIREAFEVHDEGADGGTIEQIDGAIELDGRMYLVEMKWWSQPFGRSRPRSGVNERRA